MVDQEQSLRDMIEKIENDNITHGNYKKYVEEVNNKAQMIETNIANLLSQFNAIKLKFDEQMERKTIKDMIEHDGIVPTPLFDLEKDMQDAARNLQFEKAIVFRNQIRALDRKLRK